MDLLTAIKGSKDLFDFARDLRGAYQRKEVQPGEVADRLLQIQELALELQRSLSDAQDEKRKLEALLAEMERIQRTVDDLEFVEDGNFLVRSSEKDKGKDIPYCPVCWGEQRKLIPLDEETQGMFHCVIHHHTYVSQKYHQERERHRQQRPKISRMSPW